jgi:pimeloyl-ACP methyl ester carboxylesterase
VISLNRCLWLSSVFLVRGFGLPFLLSPTRIPQNEETKIAAAAIQNDVVVVFNGGGWGDFPLDKATDFASILEGIRSTLSQLGYRSTTISYYRALPGLARRIAGTKEQLNSFKTTSQTQIRDMNEVCRRFPTKRFVLVGFSVGGGLSARTLQGLQDARNLCGIALGVPEWFWTFRSDKSLVLNNDNLDPLTTGNAYVVALNVIRSPFRWLRAKISGKTTTVALSFQFPHHEYQWTSSRVGPPIREFLARQLSRLNYS